MSQNRSTAVMQRRHEAPDSLDYFPTPPWAMRALMEHIRHEGLFSISSVWEPACGEGHMAKALAEYFHEVKASDIHDYGYGEVEDFLPGMFTQGRPAGSHDWVITNPPFNAAEPFLDEALRVARVGVAFLVRTSWLEGQERWKTIFGTDRRPTLVLQFAERVTLLKGRLASFHGKDPETGESVASATSYCWVVWVKDAMEYQLTSLDWIAPCKARLQRASDYETGG